MKSCYLSPIGTACTAQINKNCARSSSTRARFPVRRGPAPFNVYVWKLIVCVILPLPRSAILDFVCPTMRTYI